jgi:aspartyl-tRNA(Asn)/glutamyl-tRNA(Gln) amidotransferase subunit A
MREWANASLCEVADAIAAGVVSARDVAESCLDRADRLDGTLHCYVELDREATILAADAADVAVRRGVPLGPLHGVPLAHKDMYYRAGRVSACGSRLREDVVQSETATVLSRLDRAGAIETGRLVMVEFALGPHGYNANYSVCRNAWNPDYIPAGSSSGSGVAVSSGMVFASLGSDTGGSIRCPASVSGLVGLMPTYGRVSRWGVMPMSFSLDVVGPLARRARDCARLLSVIAGHDPADPTSLDAPVPDYEGSLEAPGPLPRIGVARGYFDEGLHPEVAAAVVEAAETFRRLGFPVEDIAAPVQDLSEICELHPLIMKAEGAANHMGMLRARQGDYTLEVGNRLQAGFFILATDYIQALKLRSTYLRAFTKAVFEKVDILLTPVLRNPVPTIAETMNRRGADYLDMVMDLTRNTKVVNYLGLPALSVPCGFTGNGLPTSFQLVGRPLSEASLLAAAHRYEQATGWHLAAPSLVTNHPVLSVAT